MHAATRTALSGGLVSVLLSAPAAATATDPVQSAEAVLIEHADEGSFPRYEIGGLIAGGYQFEIGTDSENQAGALTVRPAISAFLSESDELFLEFGITQANAVNADSPFSLAPWGADLEDDLENINGSDVDALQNLWYKRTIGGEALGGFGDELAITVGFIDSTEFIDQNEFANDEYTQFLNEVFVNSPVSFLQSYDLGAAVEWSADSWSVNGTVMQVSENDDGNSFLFAGAQIGYSMTNSIGPANYRLVLTYANDEFVRPDGVSTAPRLGALISADQQIGESVGVWARVGTQDDRAVVTHQNLYSGGAQMDGSLWGRSQDTAAIGYAFLDGGNDGISSTHAIEAYVRFALDTSASLTLDVQRIHDHTLEGTTDEGFVIGGRVVFEF
ncbi:MAG: carbohydrate porin [Planctomycetota bacterium]